MTNRDQLIQDEAKLRAAVHRPLFVCTAVILVFFLVFVVWGNTMQLAGGAIASGQISPEGRRRVIQHLEGGMISHIHVNEGEAVVEGQALIELRSSSLVSENRIYLSQRILLAATVTRLQSELATEGDLNWPEWILERQSQDPTVEAILETQENLFQQRKQLNIRQEEMLRSRMSQLDEEILGLTLQIESQERRASLIDLEISDLEYLIERGLAPRPRLLSLQREKATIEEQRARNFSSIAQARQRISEVEVQLAALSFENLTQISEELSRVQSEYAEIDERYTASSDAVDRMMIRAPVSGRVINLNFNTIGGVISPGEKILEIVPDHGMLIINARLNSIDVDGVHEGQRAQVRLPALPQSRMPLLEGEVRSIAPDATYDEQTGQTYYRVEIEVNFDQLQAISDRIGAPLELTPGMPAEVVMVTTNRTLWAYLTEPLVRSVSNAFRER